MLDRNLQSIQTRVRLNDHNFEQVPASEPSSVQDFHQDRASLRCKSTLLFPPSPAAGPDPPVVDDLLQLLRRGSGQDFAYERGGDEIGLSQVQWREGLPAKALPETRQEINGDGNVSANCDSQKLRGERFSI